MKSLTYRHELKFVCSDLTLLMIENRIKHICSLDPHIRDGKSYLIRSLYFDTMDNQYFYENEAGLDDRKKYRIRIYDADASIIKLECKYSVHGMKAKESCIISKEQCEQLICGSAVHAVEGQDLLKRFLIEKKLKYLQPKVIVEYTRTPYIHKVGNVRITFDRNIQSSYEVSAFLEKNIIRRSIMNQNEHVLEVKYDDILPTSILHILTKANSLRKSSFSKYALCRKYSVR